MTSGYCIDTNIVVDLNRRMPRDVYPGPWDALELLIEAKQACMPQDVYLELEHVDDKCAPWAKGLAEFVRVPTVDEVLLVHDITSQFDGWVSEKKNAADPWVIAHAVVHEHLIVTDERRRGPGAQVHNLTIPNVASAFDVDCLSFVDLARREGWRFGAVS